VDKARYLVEAHIVEGRSVSELAATHGVHRSWIYKLLARYRAGGYGALERRSRAPRRSPSRTSAELAEAIVALRGQLSEEGHDCGAATIAYHLAARFDRVPSVSTIWRILRREGLVVPQPQKRPRSSLIRFCAELPNEMWQAVFTATPRGGKVLLQAELERLGIAAKNSRPYHPQTCGKVERLHQTLKRYLSRQAPARTLTGLQMQLDGFTGYYNAIRPHRALGGRTPLQAYGARVKARPPGSPSAEAHFRVRQDKVDASGTVTLRHDSRLHHIGLGRAHQGQAVKLLVADLDIRVLAADTGELIRRLTLDPTRDYHPIGGI
jgi:transposase